MTIRKEIAKITNVMLGFEDHGIFTAFLDLDYGGTAQGLGGFCMSSEQGGKTVATPRAMDFVIRVLRAVGVSKWEDLKGRTIFALFENDSFGAKPIGIENLPTERGERFLFADWQADVRRALETP